MRADCVAGLASLRMSPVDEGDVFCLARRHDGDKPILVRKAAPPAAVVGCACLCVVVPIRLRVNGGRDGAWFHVVKGSAKRPGWP